MNKIPDTALSRQEAELVAQVAAIYGITVEECHTNLAKAGLAHQVRRTTGRNPAKVYQLKRAA
jgi:hypothetical protein